VLVQQALILSKVLHRPNKQSTDPHSIFQDAIYPDIFLLLLCDTIIPRTLHFNVASCAPKSLRPLRILSNCDPTFCSIFLSTSRSKLDTAWLVPFTFQHHYSDSWLQHIHVMSPKVFADTKMLEVRFWDWNVACLRNPVHLWYDRQRSIAPKNWNMELFLRFPHPQQSS
jgi:hypothetical protein